MARVDWDSRAADYPLRTDRPSTVHAMEVMERELGRRSVLADIGCGPGNQSIPFSGMFERVYAVDSSVKMLDRLRSECRSRGIRNVEVVEADCLEVVLPERCDVAFSGLCPGTASVEGLEKLEELSDDLCMFVGHLYPEGCIEREILRDLGLPMEARFDTQRLLRRFGRGRDVSSATFRDLAHDTIQDAVWRCVRISDRTDESVRLIEERVREIGLEGFPPEDDVMMLYWHVRCRGEPSCR